MQPTKLIVINQAISDEKFQWLLNFAREHRHVELWTGSNLLITETPNVLVVKMPRYDRSSTGRRFVTWSRFTVVAFFRLLFLRRQTSILGFTNPPFLPLLLAVVSIIRGHKYGLVEYDIYPQILASMKLLDQRHVVYRVWYRWHAWSLRKASLVLSLSPQMADELHVMTKPQGINIEIVPTWTDTDRIKPLHQQENPFVTEHGLVGQFVIIYSGNLGSTHAIETIVDVAEKLRFEPRISFVIIGEGSKRTLVENAIAEQRAPNIVLLPYQPRHVLPYSFSCAEIAFVTLAKGYERLSLPSKTYSMMAAGNVIIGISDTPSGIDAVLRQHGCGKNFSPDDVDPIVEWIKLLMANREQLVSIQKAAREAAVNEFSEARCSKRLTQAILHSLF